MKRHSSHFIHDSKNQYMTALGTIPLQEWGFNIKKPFIIAGPCSCETEEQMMETARRLKHYDISALRAGIWKPRTRPRMFEGVGSKGLPWLVNAGKQVGLPTMVEVAAGKHVQAALESGVDILWIGARTTGNPFSVQEIADVLKGVDVPVWVKNPLNPDLRLWIGGIERIYLAGIKRLGAIHRGFSCGNGKYRNEPIWELPIELRRLYPDIPIVVDPSHICGERTLLRAVTQKAFELKFDGVMLEAHCNPEEAWTDAKQQITPESLGEILRNLVISRKVAEQTNNDVLTGLRGEIDQIDNYLLEIISERMEITRKIGKYKCDNGISVLQTHRWQEIIDDRLKKAASKALTGKFVIELMEIIHKESIRSQNKIMKKGRLYGQ